MALLAHEALGLLIVIDTEAEVLPPEPVHERVKVELVVRLPVDAVPLVNCVPVHAPDAVQVEASTVDQLSVELPPLATAVGLADSVTVGAPLLPPLLLIDEGAALDPPPPPQALARSEAPATCAAISNLRPINDACMSMLSERYARIKPGKFGGIRLRVSVTGPIPAVAPAANRVEMDVFLTAIRRQRNVLGRRRWVAVPGRCDSLILPSL